MNNRIFQGDPLIFQLRQLIAGKFRLSPATADDLAADEPLIGGSLGLDSLDALELGLQVEEVFGITIPSAAESRAAFASLASLADFIRRQPRPGPVAA